MDISNLRERPAGGAMSVSELNGFIKNIFDSNRLLSSVTVRGEISNFVNHRSGHLYFSLKDADGQIRAVMFRSSASGLKFIAENGMKVTVHGSVSVYARDGSYQIYVNSMQPDGIGALYLAYEQMKERLSAEGLFDSYYKRPIPAFPSKIGVITSPTGAAVRDIINVLGRRYPLASIYLYPALVQGEGAEESLISGVDYFDKSGLVDTVIIGRGGGSIEDLWAFNSEKLARRIFAATVPIISAVGHETDFTICDFVSDLRAPTPSAAAELAVPDIRDLSIRISATEDRLDRALVSSMELARLRLDNILSKSVIKNPFILVDNEREKAKSLTASLFAAFKNKTLASRGTLDILIGKLEALSPLSVLKRGYSVIEHGGVLVSSSTDVTAGDDISIRLFDGNISAVVK